MQNPPLPRYEALKGFICGKIDNGEWKPDDRIPSETVLAEDFGVSRMTANRAIRELTAEGRLMRIAGVGTFVLAPKVRGTILEIRSISDEIAARGHTHSSRLIYLGKIRATSRIAGVLEVAEGTLVFNVVIVHMENGEPVQLETRYVNPLAAPDFLELDFSARTPSDYLLGRLPVAEIEQTIEARLPTPDEAEHLHMDLSEPCLVLDRRSRSGRLVVTYVKLVHPGRRVTLGGLTVGGAQDSPMAGEAAFGESAV